MKRDALLNRLLIAAIIGGCLPLGANHWWGFELLAHFRVQYIALALLLTIVAVASGKRRLALLLGAIAAINSWPLWPYLAAAPQPQSAFQFVVLNVNANSDNDNHSAIIDMIRASDSDLVAVIELSPALDEALLELGDVFPYRFSVPDNGNFGLSILSRFPLVEPASFSTGATLAIDSIVELPTGLLRFIAVHLMPPMGASMASARNRQLDELAAYAGRIESPLLVCGDFNLTPYSPYFERFAENAGLRDVRRGQGLSLSWPSFLPLLGIPIDHCLIRGPLDVESVERLNRIGSDHYPVQVKLVWQDQL